MSSVKLSITMKEIIITLLIMIYYLAVLFFYNQLPGLLNWFGIVLFFYSIYTWKIKTGYSFFNPYTIFQLFFTLFNYGQPIMWAFGIHKANEIGSAILFYNSGYYPSSEDVMKAQLYTCTAMLIFHFGAILFAKKNNNNVKELNQKLYDHSYEKSVLKKTCAGLMFVTVPVAIITKAQEVSIARQYGYGSLYYGAYNTQNGYTQILMYFFFPALAGYLISSDFSKKSRWIVYPIFLVYSVLGFMTGDRGGWLYSLIILIWLHSYYIHISKKQYLIIGIFGFAFLYILSVVTSVRDSGLIISYHDVINAFTNENSPIIDGCFEMGRSMALITFFLHKGNAIYPYANTYLTSVLGMISSRVLGLFGLKQVLIADWFSQQYLGITWGTGFSMIAEAFVNGGYYGGLVYLFIIGALHGKLLSYASRIHILNSPLQVFVVAAGLNAIIGFSRGALYLTLKELFYGVFLVVLIVTVIVNNKQNKLKISTHEM